MSRGITFDTTIRIEIVTETCYRCGVVFGMTEEYRKIRLEDHSISFYCPNGHDQHYVGETDAEKYKRLYGDARARAQSTRDQLEATDRSLRATRGVVTKLRNRAHAGVCPFGCRRHFANLERHVERKHPGEKLEGEA